jgi:hypothetical protein
MAFLLLILDCNAINADSLNVSCEQLFCGNVVSHLSTQFKFMDSLKSLISCQLKLSHNRDIQSTWCEAINQNVICYKYPVAIESDKNSDSK